MPSSSSLKWARTFSKFFATLTNAATTLGSNCLPDSATTIRPASTELIGLRWRCVEVMASKASATAMMRPGTGIALPCSFFG